MCYCSIYISNLSSFQKQKIQLSNYFVLQTPNPYLQHTHIFYRILDITNCFSRLNRLIIQKNFNSNFFSKSDLKSV